MHIVRRTADVMLEAKANILFEADAGVTIKPLEFLMLLNQFCTCKRAGYTDGL